jgi:hypothetical protein
MTSLRKSCMFQKTKVWACCLHFWYFVAFGISCTLCKHQKSSRSFWNDTMSSITIYLFRVMFYIRRFKRCSQAICVQDPNVGMLKSDDELFWIVHCNDPAIMFKCWQSLSHRLLQTIHTHAQVTCTGYVCWATLFFILWLGLLAWSMILQYVIWQFTSNRIKGIMFTICLCYRGSNQPFWT